MNTLLDLVNRWAERLTIRIVGLVSKDKSTVERVAVAFNERTADKQKALNQLSENDNNLFNWILKILKMITVIFLISVLLYFAKPIKNFIKKLIRK